MSRLSHLLVPANATDFWTIVLAIGTWALVLTAWRGLNSLNLTKQDMDDRKSRREKETAIAASQTFIRDIIPQCEALVAPYRAMGFDGKGIWKDLRLGENEAEYFEPAVAFLARLHHSWRIQSVEAVNSLEAWSMVMTSGLGDDEVAFLSSGTTYCSVVRPLLPLLVYVRKTRSPNAVSAVTELYTRWSKRISDLGIEDSDEPFWARLPRTLST